MVLNITFKFKNGHSTKTGSGQTWIERLTKRDALSCSECDDNLGRVFAALERSGQLENTIIIFSTDHGEQLGDHHLMNKLGKDLKTVSLFLPLFV
jgi:arylsulfatase A-like enzyme